VSGEFFVARSTQVWGYGFLFDDVHAVEFRIGADGNVNEVGIAWEKEMGENKIWLPRQRGVDRYGS